MNKLEENCGKNQTEDHISATANKKSDITSSKEISSYHTTPPYLIFVTDTTDMSV